MPNREKGFYHAWKRLVHYDPALKSSVRKSLRSLPDEAERALKRSIVSTRNSLFRHPRLFGSSFTCFTRMGRNDALAVAAIDEEKTLLTEYLAVRISMEWALFKPHLPLPEQKMER